jgi:DNA repair exonuclease SbcCD ATPase subunit
MTENKDIDAVTGEVTGISAIELLIEAQNQKIEALEVNIRSLVDQADSIVESLGRERNVIQANIDNEKSILRKLEGELEQERAHIEMKNVKSRFREYDIDFDKISQWTRKKIRIPRSKEEIQGKNRKVVENLDKIDILESQKSSLSKQIKELQDINEKINRENVIEETTSEPECLRVEVGGTVVYLSKETGFPIENIITDGSPRKLI